MCIGIPMQVVALDSLALTARCQRWGESDVLADTADTPLETVDLSLVGLVEPGQWLLVFLGAARECLTPVRAEQVGMALQALQQLDSGDLSGLDHLFADLNREPQLPDHLQAALHTTTARTAEES
ncbi:HypC/HybG/HupF family hydrogenase formation chaperone [Oceanobacter mangrovi]|uniref:HypC/HybG/HupF family hydrogenase formation chaperone n=1 Tax=Oceanobacter mangrovi TaxID=2862510 RepID=UPI001C8E2374|nr:HypC/HybG/HupF family hydrogenase formation chaperone [Oceanobacter mangrovi]